MQYIDRIKAFPGEVGFYTRTLPDGKAVEFQADLPLIAASVIKIPIMVTAFQAISRGKLDENQFFEIRPEEKMPSCGALTYMHDGLRVTLLDLITLMIILSDNTATNRLIDLLGVDTVNDTMVALDIPGIALGRKLFDAEMAAKGKKNTVTARGIGIILERLFAGTLLGQPWDQRMIGILLNQRLNGKLPFYLHDKDIKSAHKTGEDDGITHDVGIVYAEKPFVACMLSNQVDVPAFERLIQETAAELAGVKL